MWPIIPRSIPSISARGWTPPPSSGGWLRNLPAPTWTCLLYTSIAFANTDGGEIFVGVARDGSITGVENAEAEMERIGNMIRDGIKPDLTAYTAIEKVMEGGKALIHVTVSRGLKRPYHLIDKGLKPSGVFVRHGVSSVPATDEAIREMIRDSDGTAFDKMRSTNQELTFQYAQDFFSKSRLEFDEVHKHTLGLIDGDGYYRCV